MKKIKICCEIEVSFVEYKTKALNDKAERHIRRWIKDTVREISFIPIYAETDKNGSAIEDCTRLAKIRFDKRT